MYMYMDFIFTFFILPAIFQQSGKKKKKVQATFVTNFLWKYQLQAVN